MRGEIDMGGVDDPKYLKKMAKARAKAAKKLKARGSPNGPRSEGDEGRSLAERSAEAAEKQVALQRWRVAFALVSTLVAVITLVILVLRAVG